MPAPLKRPRTSPPATTDTGDLRGTVGYMMGKLEGIEGQQTRMEGKIDAIPDVVRDAMQPVVDLATSNASRIAALERADAIEKSNIAGITTTRTKLLAGIVALSGLVGTWWGIIHK